jgi:heat shock protein HslJ
MKASMRFGCAAALIATCPCATADASPTLAGTTWQLVSLQSMDDQRGITMVDDPSKYTVAFGIDGRAVFRIDCNRGNGSFEGTESDNLTFGPIATTLMACPPPTIDQRVSSALSQVRGYVIEDGQLHMSMQVDSGILTWEPVPG